MPKNTAMALHPKTPHDLPAVRRHDAAEGAKQTAPGLPPVHHPHQHHPQAPKISDELRNEALYVAESLRDKALMDNDYAASGYARDMEQEAIYAQASAPCPGGKAVSMYRCDDLCPSNEELALRIQNGDPQAAPLLLSQNEGYLTMLAASYCEQFFSGLSGGRPRQGGCAGTAGRGAAV